MQYTKKPFVIDVCGNFWYDDTKGAYTLLCYAVDLCSPSVYSTFCNFGIVTYEILFEEDN